MRTPSFALALLVGCTGAPRYEGIDANSSDGPALDAYEPDIEALSFAVATYPTNGPPSTIAAGKLTADSYPDLVVAISSGAEQGLAIFANQQDGSFRDINTVDFPIPPSAVAIGDFNGDDAGDLAFVDYRSDLPEIRVLMNNGDGTSFSGLTGTFAYGEFAMTVAKMNGDNAADLVAADLRSGELLVILGDGHGLFPARKAGVPLGASPRDLAVVDLNGDSLNDVVVATYGGDAIAVLVGDGQGGFSASRTYSVGAKPEGVATADFNEDGKIDIVSASSMAQRADVLLGNGNGSFHAADFYPVGLQPASVSTGDFNRDGHADFAVACTGSDEVTIYLGRGNGTFAGPKHTPTSPGPTRLVALDFNSDSRVDLVVNGSKLGKVCVLLNTTLM